MGRSTKYERGRRYEYKTKKALEQRGYEVPMRAAGSKGPMDLLAVGHRQCLFVQVKAGEDAYISPFERKRLLEVAHKGGAIPVVAIAKPYKEVQFCRVGSRTGLELEFLFPGDQEAA